jgi:micrococcal nuclease
MKKFVSSLVIIVFMTIFSGNSFAHPGTLDELGGHFSNSNCTYLLHEPTSIAMQAKNKAELAQLIKKYNSNAKCVRQLTVDKIDLQGHTLGGTSSSAASRAKPSTSATLQLGKKYPAKLVKCIDGDTARFIVNGKEYTTRFLFIDTPESTIQIEPYGKEASRFTCSRLKQGNITLETDGNTLFDKYHRLLAWVWAGNKLLQEEIAKAGLVEDFYDYGDYKYEDRIRAAMNEAKRNGAGMYGNSSPQKSNSSKDKLTKEDKNKTENEKSRSSAQKNDEQDSESSIKHPFLYFFIVMIVIAIVYAFTQK